ncbi:NAD-dependent epimerase/dehydratase family protein [bacterium]|jgi:dTDP-glucose 4,6-dehydratase|nr:NAD-dependent epimerase/dehydratase family protein [bacterium]MDB4235005.1 NAD-dependent epimerase/dehydratase family protein [bacterium]|tara:strand:+ start:1276 stop:2187 length:912 start_codon:yes stop_codon:yes gene_type:complete
MSKIIVTGGFGFIGSHFVNYVLENTKHEVMIIDNLTYASNLNNVKGDVEFLKKDICNITEEDLGEYEYIVHFAAESHVDNSIKNGLPFVKTNVEGTYNLLEVSRKNKNLKKFFHISTDEVYGDMDDYEGFKISDEDFNLVGSSYYSATKVGSDMLVMAAGRTFGLPYLISRTCNNYGENQHDEKFLPKIIKSIKEGKEIPVYGDGEHIREWIHADDNSKAIYTLLTSDKVKKVYNIGTGELYTNNEIISMVGDILGEEVKFKYVEDRLGHDRRYTLDSGRYINEFGDIQNTRLKNWLTKRIKG